MSLQKVFTSNAESFVVNNQRNYYIFSLKKQCCLTRYPIFLEYPYIFIVDLSMKKMWKLRSVKKNWLQDWLAWVFFRLTKMLINLFKPYIVIKIWLIVKEICDFSFYPQRNLINTYHIAFKINSQCHNIKLLC